MKDKHCRVCWKPSLTAWCEGCRKIRDDINRALALEPTPPLEDFLIRCRAKGRFIQLRKRKRNNYQIL